MTKEAIIERLRDIQEGIEHDNFTWENIETLIVDIENSIEVEVE